MHLAHQLGAFLRFSVMCLLPIYVSYVLFFFFLMIRRPPRSTQSRSSAASDVYKRQLPHDGAQFAHPLSYRANAGEDVFEDGNRLPDTGPVSYTHLRAHETVLDLVCRLLLEKKKKKK